jgi:hypothetical protein
MDDHATYVTFGTGIDAVTTIVCTAPAIPDEHGYIEPMLDSIINTGFGPKYYKVLYKGPRIATLGKY